MRLKEYEKKYENIYKNNKSKKIKFNLDKVTTDIGLDNNEYVKLFKGKVAMFDRQIFDILLKYTWLSKRFCYDGTNREKHIGNGHYIDAAFGRFMKDYINTDKSMYGGSVFYRIITYFEDFFPYFDIENPFDEEMKFPYSNIGLSHLSAVYQMDERLELLAYAEKVKMSYIDFMDYLVNYILSNNEELGYEKYTLMTTNAGLNAPYIKKQEKI